MRTKDKNMEMKNGRVTILAFALIILMAMLTMTLKAAHVIL